MGISDNLLSAFLHGVANIKENNEVFSEAIKDGDLQNIIEIIEDIDSSDDINELRKEFAEDGERYNDFKELRK